MKVISFKYFLALTVCIFFLSSCSEDSNDITNLDQVIDDRGRGGDRGGRGDNLRRIDNDLVYDWTQKFLELERYAGGMRPNASARAMAYINLATYETALPAMPDYHSNEDYLDGLNIDENQMDHRINFPIAINAAFAKSIDHFLLNLPASEREKIGEYEEYKLDKLDRNVSGQEVQASIEWGRYVADQVIAYSQTDTEAEAQIQSPQPLSYEPPTGEGYWTYGAEQERALFPYWQSVRTFIANTDETTTVQPIAYSENPSSDYYAQMQEVYEVNNTAKAEENEQLWIAEFWSDDVEGLMFSPPARQFSIANQLLRKYKLNLAEALHLYVKLGFVLNDAAVSTWMYKYQHMVMRPNVYIHEFIDPAFQTNLYRLVYWPNPTFPGYPSGHSCFASAAAGVFIDFFGDETNFIDRSHEGRTEFRGQPRQYDSFSDMAYENAYSRIPLGVHIRMDCDEGLRLGYEISDLVNAYELR